MNAVIIDDSQNAIDTLKAKLQKHSPQVLIKATFTNPKEAIDTIALFNPTIIFIDVEMPELDGFEVVKQLTDCKAVVIFVTAYNHYAVKAIRANAFDYLEKPVDVKQLKETITRVEDKLQKEQPTTTTNDYLMQQLLQSVKQLQAQSATLSLTVSEGVNVVKLSEIIHLESLSNYTKFYLSDGKQIVVSKTMGEYEELLLQNHFFRIHRSHIINLNHLRHYHKNNEAWVEMKDGSKIEVSDRKRKELTDKLNTL
jgi:two-component system LytT family response regulator